MQEKAVLRPDDKGRIGIGSIPRKLQESLGGPTISGYTAEITADGAILLRPRVEVSVEEAATLILGNRDRDAFLSALEQPPAPSRVLRAARRAHERRVRGR